MPKVATPPNAPDVPALSRELQGLQRQRAVVLKSRNMQANRLQAVVAGTLGYRASMPEKERRKKFDEAAALVKAVLVGESAHDLAEVIRVTHVGIGAFNDLKDALEKEMVQHAKRLPVAPWVLAPARRGFGLLSLAIVVGEAGDLGNYAGPAKLWRRLGCAPWTFGGLTAMGATWRAGKQGKLPAEEWEKFGYSPRRRSIAYLIGEGIVRQNGGGPHRARYDAAKADFKARHPDYSDLRCHRHGMLVATKDLLRQLWRVWTGHDPVG